MALRTVSIEGRLFTIVDTDHTQLSHAVYLAHSLDYCLTNTKSILEDPVALAAVTGKVIYTYDAIQAEVIRYGAVLGVGCVFCYMDTDNKWWLIATMNDSNDLVTLFSVHSEITSFFNRVVVDDL